MIWSEQELANLAIAGKDVAVLRVMKQLDDPKNEDIFLKKNFSLLWGVLGIAGVEGTTEKAKEKVWQSLKENVVVDAYDKGILADFNQRLAAQYNDNRMRAWLKMDNFEAGRYFNKVILKELSMANEKLEFETISYCFDGMKLISSMAKDGVTSRLKTYLESLRKQEAYNATTGTAITKVFEKEMVLRKLSDVIVTSTRILTEKEKNYLYYYLREAVVSGFDMKRIGLDDQVLSRLMADFNADEVAEVEAQSMLMRNADIMEFVDGAEETDGFFEASAAKFIKADKGRIPAMVNRCLDLIKKQAQPRGVVFALELVNLGQIKSAVTILGELAKKGSATEMVGLLHRLLPQAKGAEKVLLSILQLNLRNQHTRNPWGDNSFFFEYISRRYLQAARSFAECGFYKESAGLLQEIVLGKWFENQDDLIKEFLGLTNWLLSEDKSLEEDLSSSIKRLNLQIFREDNVVFVGTETDNPITAARHRLEQKIKMATTFDVGGVLDKMSKAESSTYGMFKNIKQALSSDKNKDKDVSYELPPIACDNIKEVFGETKNHAEMETVEDTNTVIEAQSLPQSEEKLDAVTEQSENVSENAEMSAKEDIAQQEAKQDSEAKNDKVSPQKDETDDGISSVFKKEIHFSSILKDNIQEIGDEFDKLKFVFKKSDNVQLSEQDKTEESTQLSSVADNVAENSNQPITDVSENVEIPNEAVISEVLEDNHENVPPEEENAQAYEVNEQVVQGKEAQNDEVYKPADEMYQDDTAQKEPTVEVAENVAEINDNPEEKVEPHDEMKPEMPKPLALEIQSWEDEPAQDADVEQIEENTPENSSRLGALKNRVNISKILNIKSEDVDKQFDKIKKITSSAVKKAEEKVARVKQRVEDTDITHSQSANKIRNIAKKIKFFKKK